MPFVTTSRSIHVLVSDDTRMHTELLADALWRDGSLEVTSSTSGSADLVGCLSQNRFDVLLMSPNLDEELGRGFRLLRDLRASRIDVPTVFLLDSSKRDLVVEAFRAGARGVLSRRDSMETLGKCVRRVHEGQIWANSEQMAILVEELASSYELRAVDAKGMNLLSKREIEIVSNLVQGLTNREIAERLGLSPHTIKNCLFRIFDKLGVSNRVELLFMVLSQSKDTYSESDVILRKDHSSVSTDEARWAACQQAALEGVLAAQLTLAQLYSTRKQSRNDAVLAYQWYSIVRDQVSRVCHEMAQGMSMDQLLEAEQWTANWISEGAAKNPRWRRSPESACYQDLAGNCSKA